ncbi:MAG: hybrid sensor histidine kinase/response regulator [Candidatus Omnitrophica bacterium]|nr:hybrid sensor histidine kinase/response regulator [Candidatus Omnitrophota bacterium]
MKINQPRILVIEDNKCDRDLLLHILNSLETECSVECVSSGRLGVEHLRKESFDLVILDLSMQKFDGFQVLKDIRGTKDKMLPVLLVSSFTNKEDKVQGLELGATDCINKPYIIEEVRARVQIQLKLRQILKDVQWASEKTNAGIKMLYKELDKRNKQLQEFDRLKDEFLGNVSHELRTPLTIIRESISQIVDGLIGDVPEKQRQYLSRALANIDRLKNIIDNLLDISKIEKGWVELYKEKVNLVALVKDICADFQTKAAAQNLELRYELPEDDVHVLIDMEKTIQVFTNLIGNALKFTKKGSITVSLKEWEDFVQCEVADTGMGIAAKHLPQLFNKFKQFSRTHSPGEKGTGLGLTIAKSIIELHGGNIHVESREGKGTTFIFTLPKYCQRRLVHEENIDYRR